MKIVLLLVFVISYTRSAAAAAPDFDLYIFAQSWQPAFCDGHHFPGCSAPLPFWKSHCTVHGLWPESSSSQRPPFDCSTEKLNASKIEEAIGLDVLTQRWPDVKYDVNSTSYPSFWAHEWEKHGTCSGLDQVSYFKAALRLLDTFAEADKFLNANVRRSAPTSSVRKAFGTKENVVLKCTRRNVLSQVFTCWGKDGASNAPTSQLRKCPAHVLAEDTCHEDKVFIEAFGARNSSIQ